MGERSRLRARTTPCARLDAGTRDAMWGLFEAHYVDVARDRFERDLAAKSHVILLVDGADGSVRGFSTLRLLERRVDGRAVQVLYSGDTVVDPAYWGQTALQRAFLRFGLAAALRRPFVPTYWYLISKGYKTYLLLARNFPEHWPRHDRPTPAWQQGLLEDLGAFMFPESFVRHGGVLRHPEPLGRLREGVAPLAADALAHPDVRFFVDRNPGHADGHELCCLGRIGLGLWASYTAKLLRRALRHRRPT